MYDYVRAGSGRGREVFERAFVFNCLVLPWALADVIRRFRSRAEPRRATPLARDSLINVPISASLACSLL